MDVRIDELHTSVDVVDGGALLTPATLSEIVRAVLRALQDEERRRDALRSDLDTRSVVERQREDGRHPGGGR